MTQTIPLNKLLPSPLNVRRHADADADAQLKADIAERGLLQNLVVGALAKPKGSFEVLAGGRRLHALQSLAADGVLAKTWPVPCLSIEGDDAARAEASLAENFQRLAMNPADECDAFRRMVELGSDPEGIARRFGLTVRFVEGRLRLANLAPVVLDALREGRITLDTAKAYGTSPDQERQAAVFEQLARSYNGAHPDTVRRMMTETSVNGSDKRAVLVGRDAYLAAGGRIERDLFSAGDTEQWIDLALLEKLAATRMAEAAEELRRTTGLAWVTGLLTHYVDGDATADLHHVVTPAAELSDEDEKRLEELEGRLDAISEQIEDEGLEEDAYAALEAEAERVQQEIDAITEKPGVLPEAFRSKVGAFAVLTTSGQVELRSQLWSKEPIEGATRAPYGQGGTARPPSPTVVAAKKEGLSQTLVAELAMQRRDVLAAHVASDPAFALDYAIFAMAANAGAGGYPAPRFGTTLVARRPEDPAKGSDIAPTEAGATLAALDAQLDRSWTVHASATEQFEAFRRLGDEQRGAWLAHLVARTMEASLNLPGDYHSAFHDHLGRTLSIDVAQWWRPTAANYFDRVSKATMLAALTEVGGATLSSRYAGAKKAELARTCERVFSGQFIEEAHVKEAAVRWLPPAMLFNGAAAPVIEEQYDDNDEAAAVDAPANRHDADAESAADALADAGGLPADDLSDDSDAETEPVAAFAA